MHNSVLVLLFVFLVAAFAEVLVDKLQPSVDMTYRGFKETSATPYYHGIITTPTEKAQIKFTVPASAPTQFTLKMLAKDFCFTEGNLAPVGIDYSQTLDQFKCTSNGVSVTFKAADDTPTSIEVNGTLAYAYGNDVIVMKNGITEDTLVTCSYYIYRDFSDVIPCDYESSKIFFNYTYEDQGNTMSEQIEIKPSYYSRQNINFAVPDVEGGGIGLGFYNENDFSNSTVKNGDTFTIAFDGPFSIPAASLLEDGSVNMTSMDDIDVNFGSCIVSGSTFTCTWADISETDTSSFGIYVHIDLPKPFAGLGAVITGLAHTEPFYVLVANPEPTPVFGPMFQNTIADTPVTFYLPSDDDAAASFSIGFKFDSVRRVYGRKCVSNGVTYANIAAYTQDTPATYYNVTFTAEGIAARNSDNAISCMIVTNLKIDYLNYNSMTYFFNTNLFPDTWFLRLNHIYNGPLLGAMPISTSFANNYISLDTADITEHLDSGRKITVVGVIPSSSDISFVTCRSAKTNGSPIDAPAIYTAATKTISFTIPDQATSCMIPASSSYKVGDSVSVYADDILVDSKKYVDTVPAANTFVNNFVTGVKSTSYITFKNLAIGLLVNQQDFITMDATVASRISTEEMNCYTVIPTTNTTLTTLCYRIGNNYTCNFYFSFASAARYADITCAITAIVSDSTEDLIFTAPGNNSVNIGPAAADTSERKPSASLTLTAYNLAKPIPAGTSVFMHFALYDIDLVAGDSLAISLVDADMQLIDYFSDITEQSHTSQYTLSYNATHVTLTILSTIAMPCTCTFTMTTLPAAGYTPQVVITNANGDGNALKTVDTSMIFLPDMYADVDIITPIPGPNATTAAIAIETNQPQVVEVELVPGSIDGEPIFTNVAFEGESNCGDVTQDADGVYRVWADATALPAGTTLECTLVMTIEKSYFCTDDCSNAPKLSIFSGSPDMVAPITIIPTGEATIKLARTRGAFTSDTAGFAIYASYFTPGSNVTVDNDFGITAPINVYAVTDTEVGETPVGSATSDGNGGLIITVNDLASWNDPEISFALEGFSGYVAIPVFESAQVLPTIKAVEITATVDGVTSAPITVDNGDPVIGITPAEFTAPIRENTEFFVNFTLSSNHLDTLTAKIDFSAAGATFVACESDLPDDMPLPYVSASMKLTDDVPEAEAEDGILTVPVPKTDATIEDGLAKYSYMCSFTAGAYVKGKTAATVPIDVMFGTTVVKTADLTVPAPSRLPVTGTKLSVSIVRDTLFTSAELTAILNALVKTMQAIDPTFDISRLYGITQKLNVYSPSAIHVAAGSTVTLSTSFTGVTVTDTAALAADTKSSVEALGYEADVDVEGADIEVTCTEGCGTEECGLCLDGNACTDAAQCFSGKCGGGVCGRDNSAASVSVALCAALAAFASVMFF